MCGYDPFYWYEYDLDKEYLERTGDNFMDGFRQAQAEYENTLDNPFDEEPENQIDEETYTERLIDSYYED